MYEDLVTLIDIQNLEKQLQDEKLVLSEIEKEKELDSLLTRFKVIKESINNYTASLELNVKAYRELEIKLIDVQEELNSLDEEIYSGKSNSKELHYMLQEKDNNKELVNVYEEELMRKLEERELFRDEIDKYSLEEEKLSTLIEEVRSNYGKEIQVLEDKVKSLQDEIIKLESKISVKLLNEYKTKGERLGFQLACYIKQDGICGGCHVKIPSRTLRDINNQKTAKCDECGRYLVIEKN
jgi:hypothetical protein